MAGTNFPTSLDDNSSMPAPGPGDTVAAVDHAQQHDTVNAASKAIEAKVGIGASTPTASKLLRATSTGTSSWAQAVLTTDVTGTLPVANGGSGVTSSTGTGNLVLSSGPTLTNPVFTNIVNTGTLTLPTSTDTLVGRATTDTLTNKTIDGGSNTLTAIPGSALSTTAISLGYAQIVASVSGFSVETDIVSVTVTIPAGGRDIEIIFNITEIATSVNGQRCAVQIKEGATGLKRYYKWLPSTSGGNGGTFIARVAAPTAGSHTYKATLTRDVGAGTIDAYAAASPDQTSIHVKLI